MPSQSHPESAEELFYRGLDLLAAGRNREAVETLHRCLEIDPAMLDARHGLIRALQESGELDEAIAQAHRLIEMDPEETLAHTSLSILYQRKGMIAEAEAEGLKAKLLGWKKQLREQS